MFATARAGMRGQAFDPSITMKSLSQVRPSCRATAAAFAVVALATAPAARAQRAEPQSLDAVVVTASRAPQPLADALPHTTVLTREDIERAQALDLPALLARESGVQLVTTGGRGSATTLFVRGAPSRQVRLLVDGVPMTRQDATGSLGLEHLMLDQVERVEIVRGNVSALYGSGAVGGVVQVFTRRGDAAPRASVTLEGGELGFGRAAAAASGAFGDTTLSVGLAHQRLRGFSAQDPALNPAVNPDDDGYRNGSASASIAHRIADGHRLGLSMSASDGRLDYDSGFATPTDVQTSRTRLGAARAFAENRYTARWSGTFAVFAQRDHARYRESGAFGFDSRTLTRTRGVSWLHRVELSDGWRLDAGLEHERQSISSDDGFGSLVDRHRSVNALLLGAGGRVAGLELQANLRHDDIEGTGQETTGRLALGWSFAEGWKAVASIANAFNAPPLGYLHAPFFGNPALSPERARSAELGLQWSRDTQSLRATAFEQRVRDELDYDLATNSFRNLARTRNRGLEVSWGARFAATDLRASLTSQQPLDEATGQRRVRRAATLASLALTHGIDSHFGSTRVGAAWRYTGARPEIAGQRLGAYSVVDLTLQHDLGREWRVFARLENAGDERYETAVGYRQPPRSAFVGLRWSGTL